MAEFPQKFNGPKFELNGTSVDVASLKPGMARRIETNGTATTWGTAYIIANNNGVYETYREESLF